MRFPFRLAADLSFALVARSLSRNPKRPLVTYLDGADLRDGSSVELLKRSNSPIIWVGGDEPLSYTQIPHVVRGLIASGRFVFLQTDGSSVARRIHEFHPVSRLFWVIPFDCSENLAALEAVRRVKLSGFLTCAHTQVCLEDKSSGLLRLREHLRAVGVDGWVMSTEHAGCPSVSHHARLRQKFDDATRLIPSWRWRAFSALVNAALSHRPCETEIPEPEATLNLSQTDDTGMPQSQSAGAP